MRAVCEAQLCGDGADGLARFCQVLRRFFHAEGQAIIIQTHASKFVDNAVEVVAAVMKQLFKLAACHAPVTLLKEPCDA